MGQKILIGALAMVFLATACGPIRNKKQVEPVADEVVSAGFNSGFNGAIYFNNKESYQRLDMHSGQSENFLASGPNMTSSSHSGDRFVTVKRSNSYPEILILGKNKETVVRFPIPENPEGTPKLSPNGEFVLVGGIAGDTKIFNLNGQMVADLRTNVSSYEWLPDGSFLFSRFGTIYQMQTDFKTFEVYRQLPGSISSLSLNPDHTKLAFEMQKSTGTHVWVLDLADKSLRQITTSTVGEHFPAWSPDGHHLVVAKGKLAPIDLITSDQKVKVQGCLELWIVKADRDSVSDLNSEDLAHTFKVKQNVDGQSSQTCATSAPLWRVD